MYQVEMVRTFVIAKTKWLLPLLLLFLFVWVQVSPIAISAYAGLGGYVSEKMLSGAAIDSLYLSRTTAGPSVIASGPVISTEASTGVAWPDGGVTTATLHGVLSSLNGLPRATYYFRWGYTLAMTNTTPSVTVTTTGDKTATITGWTPGVAIYYQFVAGTDGTSYGGILSFKSDTVGSHAAYTLLWNVFTICIALGMIASALLFIHNPVALVVLSILGMIAVMFARAILGLSIW